MKLHVVNVVQLLLFLWWQHRGAMLRVFHFLTSFSGGAVVPSASTSAPPKQKKEFI